MLEEVVFKSCLVVKLFRRRSSRTSVPPSPHNSFSLSCELYSVHSQAKSGKKKERKKLFRSMKPFAFSSPHSPIDCKYNLLPIFELSSFIFKKHNFYKKEDV
jgi:hypothetical protein